MIDHYARLSKTAVAQSAAELKRLRQDLDWTTREIAISRLLIDETLKTLQISTDVARKSPKRNVVLPVSQRQRLD
jgi:hypothetical protein